MNDIRNLEPKELWGYFSQICEIPHPSKKEKKMIEFVRNFGKSQGLETLVDETGNVVIKKKASPGMENRKTVVLQAHLDMVPQKNSDKEHDFEKDPIKAYVDGEWVTADGTTLGADNGIGVAAAMAVLSSENLKHGPVEALFTIDEETGMTGANNLKPGYLDAEILINMDSEDEGELYVGCAGGINVTAQKSYTEEQVREGMKAYRINAKGMKGGHSGIDIPLGRANANQVLFRFLMQADSDLNIKLAEASGGDLRNAIPRESHAVVVVPENNIPAFESLVNDYDKIYKDEYGETEPEISFTCSPADMPSGLVPEDEQYGIIRSVYACPHGVIRMSTSMEGLVETSNNMAVVNVGGGSYEALCLTRSSVDTAKEATAWKIAAVFQLMGAEIGLSGSYPGWKPDMNSPILKTMQGVYDNMFGKVPEIKAIHAGLECGIIAGAYPHLDMISFGPTIRYPHSPDEKVNTETVRKFWAFLVGTLEAIPEKE
ncbi:MAG TPA: cytosol nonspecific dipeptidase [Bacteroidales bacterium]|nr:cytosol nonspecific dipeptidase [Bacteroidales bacterium]